MVSEPSSPPSIPSPISSMSASPVSSQESVIDPYLIHHSDSPTAVLVSPVLSGDNHGTWIRAITMALRAKNKLGFVDGSISKPTSEKELSSWARCNDLVSSWILNSVSPDIRTSVLYADTARDIWNDLHERFSQSNAPKIYQLKQAISGLKQEGSTVSVYFTQLKSLWDELNSIIPIPPCICGNGKATVERLHQDRAMEFLQGLHDRFAAIRSQILLMEPFPTTTRIYSLIRQEEKQQEINNSSVPTVECAALHTGNQVMRHSSHHSSSHKRQRPFCDHCNRHGHTKATCYKLHGYPPKSKDMAAGTWSNLGPTSVDSSRVVPAMSFTPEQYAKILNLLSSGPSEPSSVPTANLAGPIDEEADWSG